jgi:hypothetical protein
LGLKAARTISSEDNTREAVIIGERPQASENEPASTRATASVAVASESERLATAGVTPNSFDKTGSRGWVQYSIAKVARPATNSARLARRNSGVPRRR